MNDARIANALATAGLIAVGLLTRLPLIVWPDGLGKYAGALLWGAMVYCIVRFIGPSVRIVVSVAVAAAAAALIELSQLWHPMWFDILWLDEFRATTIGVLLLGRYFAWVDIGAYAVGIGVAAAVDFILRNKR